MASLGSIQVKPIVHMIGRQPGIDYRGAAKSAKRNLFGAPEKGETDALLKKEMEAQRLVFVSRYKIEEVMCYWRTGPEESCHATEVQQESNEIKLRATQSNANTNENRRVKPYDRQQKSMTDYYNQRKSCNKCRTVDVNASDDMNETPSSIPLEEIAAIKCTADTVPAFTTITASSESPSILLQTPERVKESIRTPQEKITLHIASTSTDHDTELS